MNLRAKIDKLIINSAYREPAAHWRYNLNTQKFDEVAGRRPAGYFIAGQGANAYNDIGQFIELPLVNEIRRRVKLWREAGYPGVTGVTKKLLEHWNDNDARQYPFFWCQKDAIETLIWLVEAPPAERVGIIIPRDGGNFRRICTKLCTGGGKTTVMAMLIAWQICNKATYPRDKRFSKNVFIVAPGLTVKSRLQVLLTGGGNYYADFNVVPRGISDKLRQGKVVINNWQALDWESAESIGKKKGVDKRGAKSDEAYAREVLGEMAKARNILVINDEAHHAWRRNPEIKVTGREAREAAEEATVWINGLDRINKTRGILTCYDFSATPFAPSGKKNDAEALFEWIVSDFGLNDGIESGLVKTPCVVVRDDVVPDTETFKSKLYHIYTDETVRDDINRSALPEDPLPTLLTNAYWLLGADWRLSFKEWKKDDSTAVPPVMITVANRIETAARIKHMFDHTNRVPIDELCVPEYTLQVDSTTIESNAALREKADTVGQKGKPGEQIRNIISVAMLSEGWDAKTVRRIILMLSMGEIVRHLWDFIKVEQTDSLVPVFDSGKSICSTGDMNTWYTSKPCKITEKCHISHCVFDSAWEDAESYKIQNNPNVEAWVKNDHLGFEVMYVYDGVVRKYYPDFLIRLKNGKMLVLETKGRKSPQSEAKRKALSDWISAVNGFGNYGEWCADVSYNVADVDEIIGGI